jgi:hypothetical protein
MLVASVGGAAKVSEQKDVGVILNAKIFIANLDS